MAIGLSLGDSYRAERKSQTLFTKKLLRGYREQFAQADGQSQRHFCANTNCNHQP